MYIRIYPDKNNTLFKNTSGTTLMKSGNINTGMNPKFRLMDGNSNSIIVMQFDLSSIAHALTHYNYTCNLKMFDCGPDVGGIPVLKDLKPINLYYFLNDFVEGDGWSFVEGKAKEGVSNWNKRDSINDWTGCFTVGLIPALHLNHATEDIFIPNLQSFIADSITNDKNPNFALQLATNTFDEQSYMKYIFSRYTRTIYKPYLEFFINDEIIDNRENIYATIPTKLHLVNHLREDFVGVVTCNIVDVAGVVIDTPPVVNSTGGTYYVNYTPDISLSDQVVYDIWSIDGKKVRKNLIQIKSPNMVNDIDLSNLTFWPATYYQHPLVKKGDKLKFSVNSEFRARGVFISKDYEYKVVCTNGFEIQPWMPISVYDNKMYFIIDTSYYFEELEYEVILRLNTDNRIQTSPQTQKFRVLFDGPTHLTGVSASPYDSRNIYLDKNY